MLEVEATNAGGAEAPPVAVELRTRGPTGAEEPMASAQTSTLAPGEGKTVRATWSLLPLAGSVDVRVVVDPEKVLVEDSSPTTSPRQRSASTSSDPGPGKPK